MPDPVVMSCSRAYPTTVEQAFDLVLPVALEQLFDRRYGPIPAIRAVEGQRGVWGEVGQTRTVRLSGGGSMREELTAVERPHSFGYTLSDVTGPMKPLASHIHGLWSFAPVGTGTRITWGWTLYPASVVAAPVLPIFRRLWHGYARQSLQRIENLLLPV
jgi:Polyketide cyclase / dehydrase and lipid transport